MHSSHREWNADAGRQIDVYSVYSVSVSAVYNLADSNAADIVATLL